MVPDEEFATAYLPTRFWHQSCKVGIAIRNMLVVGRNFCRVCEVIHEEARRGGLKMGYYPCLKAKGKMIRALMSLPAPASVMILGREGTALRLVTSDDPFDAMVSKLDAETGLAYPIHKASRRIQGTRCHCEARDRFPCVYLNRRMTPRSAPWRIGACGCLL